MNIARDKIRKYDNILEALPPKMESFNQKIRRKEGREGKGREGREGKGPSMFIVGALSASIGCPARFSSLWNVGGSIWIYLRQISQKGDYFGIWQIDPNSTTYLNKY